MKRKYNNMRQEMQGYLDAANAALAAGNEAEYRAQMDKANELKPKLEQTARDIATMDAYGDPDVNTVPNGDGGAPGITDLVATLQNRGSVSLQDIRNALGKPKIQNNVVVSTAIATPTAAGSTIRGGDRPMMDLIGRVTVSDLSGSNGILEPYVKTEPTAAAGKLESVGGTARSNSDPAFGVVELNAYETSVTIFVDRNLARVSPASYLQKVLSLAERAWRRKVNSMIVKGDSEATHKVFGILNAVDRAGTSMVTTVEISEINENTVSELVFSYGGNEEAGASGELHLTKKDLKELGKVRGYDKKKVFEITPNPDGNTGIIKDGGLAVPYSIDSNLTALADASADDDVMYYGDPINYELGTHGDMTIRIDESVKAVERMHAVLVDGVISGNVVVQGGFVVAKKAAAQDAA